MAGPMFKMTEDRSEFGESDITLVGSGRTTVGGIDVMKEFRITMHGWEAAGVELQMQCAVINGMPRCTAVLFHMPDQDADVPAWIIRDFHLEDMIEGAFARASIMFGADEDAWAQMRKADHSLPGSAVQAVGNQTRRTVRTVRKEGRTRYSDDLLRSVAAVYNANTERFPTKAVRVEFDVSQTTAQTYVRKAREAGYITKAAQRTGRPPKSDD